MKSSFYVFFFTFEIWRLRSSSYNIVKAPFSNSGYLLVLYSRSNELHGWGMHRTFEKYSSRRTQDNSNILTQLNSNLIRVE